MPDVVRAREKKGEKKKTRDREEESGRRRSDLAMHFKRRKEAGPRGDWGDPLEENIGLVFTRGEQNGYTDNQRQQDDRTSNRVLNEGRNKVSRMKKKKRSEGEKEKEGQGSGSSKSEGYGGEGDGKERKQVSITGGGFLTIC